MRIKIACESATTSFRIRHFWLLGFPCVGFSGASADAWEMIAGLLYDLMRHKYFSECFRRIREICSREKRVHSVFLFLQFIYHTPRFIVVRLLSAKISVSGKYNFHLPCPKPDKEIFYPNILSLS